MFRPCWVIFRENFSLHWSCTLQLSENVLLTVYCVGFGGVSSPRAGPDRGEFTPSVTLVNGNEKFSLKMTQQGRNM
jgi:hypothetical protein